MTVRSKNTFIPTSRNLAMIFTNDNSNEKVSFSIPDFQRQYSWKNNNLNELWKDLIEAQKNKDELYFLGSIVLVAEKKNKFQIIDGQQRLTTLVIMMDVLLKDFKNKLDKTIIKRIEKYHSNKFILQNNPNYEEEFHEEIREKQTFNHNPEDLVSEKELANSDPRCKYKNTAYFFYDKFKELDKNEMKKLISYIFDNIFVIRTICYDENFAIKMFISLNDRGLPLSNADNFKSWLYSKCEKDKRNAFNQNWKILINDTNELKITMDDFIVWYEYSLIRSNPKMNVVDVLKIKLEQFDTTSIMSKLRTFMKNVKKVYNPSENTNLIYSLKYIRWKPYVMSIISTALMNEYHDMTNLLKLLRKFYYIAWGSGGNISSVKQTSFNILECVVNNSPIDDIENYVNNFIYRKNRITSFYNNINGNVYDTEFFKPLLMSVEYEEWEDNSLKFQPLDNKLNLDHILPKAYETDINHDWDYISNHEEIAQKMNTIGNMALLQWYKNDKALNKGFRKKLNLYNGYEEDGITPIKDEKGKGPTKFKTTQQIIEDYKASRRKWTLKSIEERKEYLIQKIEKMLDIKEEDKNINFDLDNKKSGKSKWKYNGNIYDNKSFIRQLLSDYIVKNKIKKFKDIPNELATYKVYHREFITNIEELHCRYELEINGMKLYVSGVYYASETPTIIEMLKKYYEFEYEKIEK